MGQPGFFDLGERYRGLDAKKDPLVVLNAVVPWEDFRARLRAVWRKPEEERKSAAGRKPWDAIVIFKTLVLQALYNLSDDQIEYQIRDRLSFMRFLGLGLADQRWCKIAALGLGSAAVGRIGPLPRSPDDRCPTRPMNRAATRSPGRATRSATGRRTTGRCSSGAASQSGSRRRRLRLGIRPAQARGRGRAVRAARGRAAALRAQLRQPA